MLRSWGPAKNNKSHRNNLEMLPLKMFPSVNHEQPNYILCCTVVCNRDVQPYYNGEWQICVKMPCWPDLDWDQGAGGGGASSFSPVSFSDAENAIVALFISLGKFSHVTL